MMEELRATGRPGRHLLKKDQAGDLRQNRQSGKGAGREYRKYISKAEKQHACPVSPFSTQAPSRQGSCLPLFPRTKRSI